MKTDYENKLQEEMTLPLQQEACPMQVPQAVLTIDNAWAKK